MKKVLLTGASGFIGQHCLNPLISSGYEIHAVSRDARIQPSFSGVNWHTADLLDKEQVSQLLEALNPTHLLHVAWYPAHGDYWTSEENLKWTSAGEHLVEQFARLGGKRFVGVGTCAEYDWHGDGLFIESSTPVAPTTLYGACKNALRLSVDALADQVGLSTAWGRVFYLYGPHEHPTRLVASVINSLVRGAEARCTHGRQVRDFLHVQDVADALVALLNSEVKGVVNIGSGTGVAINEVVGEIGRKLNCEDLIKLGAIAAQADEPRRLVADVTRLREEVGWSPRRDLSQGLDETIAWWRARLKQ